MTRMLSVRQPWAALIVAGRKSVENRSWTTSYRGRIGVHASTALAKGSGVPTVTSRMDRDRGYVLGTALLASVHTASLGQCAWHRCAERGGMLPGDPLLDGKRPEHWILEDPREFVTPIHAKGALSLWTAGPTLEHLMSIAEVQ